MLLRGRVHTIRGKGKTAFLVLRQRTATVQCVISVDDTTVSRGMVKYATGISKESVIDIAGTIAVPSNPVTSCSQSQVRCEQRTTSKCVLPQLTTSPCIHASKMVVCQCTDVIRSLAGALTIGMAIVCRCSSVLASESRLVKPCQYQLKARDGIVDPAFDHI